MEKKKPLSNLFKDVVPIPEVIYAGYNLCPLHLTSILRENRCGDCWPRISSAVVPNSTTRHMPRMRVLISYSAVGELDETCAKLVPLFLRGDTERWWLAR